jgi:hypothetical protein
MEKEFIPYEQALALKELGFDEHYLGFYYDEKGNVFHNSLILCYLIAPLYQQAFRWFREKYNIHCETFHNPGVLDNPWSFSFYFMKMRGRNTNVFHGYETYEEAELECLKKLIEIVKEK